MRAEVDSIDQGRHSHCHYNVGRTPFEKRLKLRADVAPNSKARPQKLFEKPFHQSGHITKPQRKYDQEMLRPGDAFLRAGDRRGHLTASPLAFGSQQGKIQMAELQAPNQMAVAFRRQRIGLREPVAEMRLSYIRMALNDEDPCHRYAVKTARRDAFLSTIRREAATEMAPSRSS